MQLILLSLMLFWQGEPKPQITPELYIRWGQIEAARQQWMQDAIKACGGAIIQKENGIPECAPREEKPKVEVEK